MAILVICCIFVGVKIFSMKKLVFLALIIPYLSVAQLPSGCELNVLVDSLDAPWEIEWGRDNRLWFTEKFGKIKALNVKEGTIKELTKLPNVITTGEGGLLGMAFDPEFNTNKYIYCIYNYTPSAGLQRMRLVRYQYEQQADTLLNLTVILDGIKSASIHNGARIVFDAAGKILVSTGNAEGNGAPPPNPNSQNNDSPNGKVLRLNSDGSIPTDNPIPGSYIYSKGHRNIQGLAFGKNRLYASEHGLSEDEINIIGPNRNYGWPGIEAWANLPAEIKFKADSNCVNPIFVFNTASTAGDKAPSGMIYYDHPLIPSLRGALLVGTLNANGRDISQFTLSASGDSIISTATYFRNQFGRIRDLAQSPDGRIFFCTSNKDQYGAAVLKPGDDKIYEIKPIGYTAIVDKTANPLMVYPNPAIAEVQVEVPSDFGQFVIKISNFDGKTYYESDQKTSEARKVTVDTSKFPNGMYILQLQTGQQTFVSKLIITK